MKDGMDHGYFICMDSIGLCCIFNYLDTYHAKAAILLFLNGKPVRHKREGFED